VPLAVSSADWDCVRISVLDAVGSSLSVIDTLRVFRGVRVGGSVCDRLDRVALTVRDGPGVRERVDVESIVGDVDCVREAVKLVDCEPVPIERVSDRVERVRRRRRVRDRESVAERVASPDTE
jgi:hypothetical protein